MHELGLAKEILRLIEENAARHGEGKVLSAVMRVGALAGVEAEALRFGLAACSRGTRAEGMEIRFNLVHAELLCNACGGRTQYEPGTGACPACGSSDLRIEGGQELQLESFEME